MKFSIKHILLVIVASLLITAQTADEWELISSSNNTTTYVNAKELTTNQGNDVYVWILEKHNPPIIIESVDGRIYKSKTYYLFSKEYQRYSMLQIIYYDEDDNVLKSFDYNRKSEIPEYKYNYPIMRGSNEEAIFQKIMMRTSTEKEGTE